MIHNLIEHLAGKQQNMSGNSFCLAIYYEIELLLLLWVVWQDNNAT